VRHDSADTVVTGCAVAAALL